MEYPIDKALLTSKVLLKDDILMEDAVGVNGVCLNTAGKHWQWKEDSLPKKTNSHSKYLTHNSWFI